MSTSDPQPVYRIHPGIGIARLGDSPTEFCISPERPAAMPIACDGQGNAMLSPDGKIEVSITRFKDAEGRIKRQAARFYIYAYDEKSPEGRALKIGDAIKGGGNHGTLIDIQWQVYVANKKSSWYEFDALKGERGYGENHKRRNADVTDDEARQKLIIDPGPQVVNATTRRTASFDRDQPLYAPTFPPELSPRSINTLGDIKTDNAGRLLVLGGHGNSGTVNSGLGHPRIDTYANNDGWFDDVSDGVVMARLVMFSKEVGRIRFIDVEYPAWVIVGYPAYVPEVLDIVTLDDVIYDLAIREFAYRTDLYGQAGTFDDPQQVDANDPGALMHWKRGKLEWNPDYRPWFYRDVWPILFRADEFTHLTNVLEQSNYPHNQTSRGNFDVTRLSIPPFVNAAVLSKSEVEAMKKNQSGTLFIEALEPTLAMLDIRLKTESQEALSMGFLHALHWQNPQANESGPASLRERLRRAVNSFAKVVDSLAETIHPDGLGEDPHEYLKRWKEVYEKATEASQATDFKKTYMEAKDALESEVKAVFDYLIKEVTGESGLKEKVVRAALARRIPPKQPLEKDTPRPIENSFEIYLKELRTGKMLGDRFEQLEEDYTYDFYKIYRVYLFELLRQPGEENDFRLGGKPNNRVFNLPLMPLLCGDNPLTNYVPSKFLRLTDYQLFILRQWADGKFYNEQSEGWVQKPDPYRPYENWENKTARDLDRAVLMNLLGGAFCPGGEVGWIVRNPSLYKEPYRIKADPDFYNFMQTAAQANANSRQLPVPSEDYVSSIGNLLSQETDFERGMQPGDLTKQMALPWQSDFNECSIQPIDVTYEQWNVIDPDSEEDPWMKREQQAWDTLWWPAHRPLQTFEVVGFSPDGSPIYQYLNWSRGVPQTNAGDLKMVTEWPRLGFVIRNPYIPEPELDQPSPETKYISVERAEDE